MLGEFKAFVLRGNVLDLAVAVLIGAAFGTVVASLTDDLITPLIGLLTGGIDFSHLFVRLGEIPASYNGDPLDYAALKKAGVPLLGYGRFLATILNFVIVAAAIFLIVRVANRIVAPAAVADAGPTPSEALLAEIRDELRARPLV